MKIVKDNKFSETNRYLSLCPFHPSFKVKLSGNKEKVNKVFKLMLPKSLF